MARLASCSLVGFCLWAATLTAAWAHSIPFPIVFIHGFNETAERWYSIGELSEQLLELQFGGTLKATKTDRKVRVEHSAGYHGDADFFFVEFSSAQLGVFSQVEELRAILKRLRRDSSADRFVLVGFSMGGLVGRAYLVRYPRRHYVAKLLTIGAPHQGSNLAAVYDAKQQFCSLTKNIGLCDERLKKVESTLFGFRLDCDALRDMRPPDNAGSNLLAQLAHAKHPSDVSYAAIVGEAPKLADEKTPLLFLEELSKGKLSIINALTAEPIDTVRRYSKNLLVGGEGWTVNGDGVVSVTSQDLTQLPWFRDRVQLVQHEPLGEGHFLDRFVWDEGQPIEIYTLPAHHHLASARDVKVLWRMIAGPSRLGKLKFDPSFWGEGRITGQVRDYLFQPKWLTLEQWTGQRWEAVPARPRVAGFSFGWSDIPWSEGTNRFQVRYRYPQIFDEQAAFQEQSIEIAPAKQRVSLSILLPLVPVFLLIPFYWVWPLCADKLFKTPSNRDKTNRDSEVFDDWLDG
jgi:pimeloyl-ACP methyl ester carboxylesterase